MIFNNTAITNHFLDLSIASPTVTFTIFYINGEFIIVLAK